MLSKYLLKIQETWLLRQEDTAVARGECERELFLFKESRNLDIFKWDTRRKSEWEKLHMCSVIQTKFLSTLYGPETFMGTEIQQ